MDMKRCEDYERTAETLYSWLQTGMAKGVECANAHELGQVTDMIKDMEEAARNHYEACYYKTVIEAMQNGREPAYGDEAMGYNHRHLSNGQFASAGRGHMVSGYHSGPYMDQGPYIDAYMHDPDFERNMKSGNHPSKYGQAYENYTKAKRNYTESKSSSDKEMMNSHAMEHVRNLLGPTKEMWREGDPMLKSDIKQALSEVLKEM